MKRWHQSIFTKLFIFFLIIIIPLQIIQVSMYKWSRDAVSQELYNAAASNVIYLRDNFEANIESINIQMEYLLNNYILTNFYISHDFFTAWEYYSNVGQINDLLYLIKNSNPYIEEIILYYPTFEIALSSDMKIESVETAKIQRIITDFKNQKSLFMESEGRMIIGHMVPSTAYYNDKLPEYFIQAVLYEAAVKTHLSSFSQYSNKNAFLLNHSTGSIHASSASMLNNTSDISQLYSIVTPRDNSEVYSFSFSLYDQNYIVVACFSEIINCSFVQFIPSRTLETIPDKFRLFILIFSVVAAIVIIIYSFFTYWLVKHPMNDFIKAFSITGKGDFDQHLTPHYSSYEYNRLVVHFNTMTDRIKTLIQTNYEQTIRVQQAELKQLQSQINPHFLYNSFFLLRHMIGQDNDDQAKIFVSYLGNYFKYITKSGSDLVPLQMEYEHATNYLTIQMMRFGARISSTIQPLPESHSTLLVPKLILQPIFENIMEHGVRKNGNDNIIRMKFSPDDAQLLHIIIEDNGDQLTDEKLAELDREFQSGTPIQETAGLINIHKRLQLYFGPKCGLEVSRSELGGLCVNIILPLSSLEEDIV